MGFRIDFTIMGGKLIDDNGPKAVYTQDIHVSGNSITDSIGIEQDGKCIWFDENQFEEFIRECMKSSIFCGFKEEIRNNE